jgi:tetratricopeptide (TPR) repeat protein
MSENKEFNLEERLDNFKKFAVENQKSLSIIVGAAVVLIGIYIGYNNFYLKPREVEAAGQMFQAEYYFERDSLDKALNGDGSYPGFLAIIEDYSGTSSANLAHFYAGVCMLKQGKFEESIDYLEDFDSNDEVLKAQSLGLIGDAQMELKAYDEASKFYKKAVSSSKNKFTSPIYLKKLGLAYELSGEFAKAEEAYKTIQSEYNESPESSDIDKLISRAQVKAQ